MLIVLSYCDKDREQALRLAEWIPQLGGCKGHSLLLLQDRRCQPVTFTGFDSVETILYDDHFNRWPESPNQVFAQAARHIAQNPQPWLWIEADVVPLEKGWADTLWNEYLAAKKPFLGDRVDVNDVPIHMSGIGIYPGRLSKFAGTALIAGDVAAWDVVAAPQIVPQMHTSKHILHAWKHPAFSTWEDFEKEVLAFKPECVLFHADKTGSLYPILRARMSLSGGVESRNAQDKRSLTTEEMAVDVKGSGESKLTSSSQIQGSGSSAPPAQSLPVPVLAEPNRINEGENPNRDGEARESTIPSLGSDSRGGQFITDILIKSYPADFERLHYCLRSIEKFVTGIRKIIVVVPRGSWTKDLGKAEFVEVDENGEGYLFQQAVKANAHEFSDAEYVLHVDSDMFFIRPTNPEMFFRNGKPLWLMTPYESIKKSLEELQRTNPGLTAGALGWHPITEKFMGEPVEYEFMRRLPMLIPTKLHKAAAVFCKMKHEQGFSEYIVSQPSRAFSEFNALGALAYARARDEFTWLDTTKEPLPEVVALQKWSHAPFDNAAKQEIETYLAFSGIDFKVYPDIAVTNNRTDGNIIQTKEGLWVLKNDSHISRWIEQHGKLQHDGQTLPRVLEHIKEGDVVIDGGAFVGDTTGPFLERVGPKGKVYAFEPNPDAFECLKRNCPDATCYQFAIGDGIESSMGLADGVNAGARHLQAGDDITVWSIDGWISALSTCGPRLDFIKLDVEGFELRALKGAEQTIMKFRPKMLIEINKGALERQGTSPQEVYDWLGAHEYEWEQLTNDDAQFDILCTPWPWPRGIVSYVEKQPDPKPVPITRLNLGIPPRNRTFDTMDSYSVLPRQERIRSLATELATFCSAPRYTAAVRAELRAAGVLPDVKPKKRRKKRKDRKLIQPAPVHRANTVDENGLD